MQIDINIRLLNEQDLTTNDLSQFNTIMTSTRTYAIQEDLKTYNRHLLDYMKKNNNLIVLYNTQEFMPNLYTPYPAKLTADTEEISKEDSPIKILTPNDQILITPNRITKTNFNN